MSTVKSIGTRNESSLHKTLKFQYTGENGQIEVETGGFVADGIRENGEYIEVQTGSFAPLKKKVNEIVKSGKVRIIYPIAVKKIIEVYEPLGKSKTKFLYRRKSPVKGSKWSIFDALVHAPLLPLIKNVTIEIVLADIIEIRLKDGKGARRRKGLSIKDHILSCFHESIEFSKPSDYLYFIPYKKKEEFTSSDLSEKAGINITTARKTLYVLSKMKLIKKMGKIKNAILYSRQTN